MEEATMRFYTGRGDDGTTDLLGARVDKSDPRVETLGALDETTSAIGLARALAANGGVRETLVETQRDLYRVMAELAFTADVRPDSYVFEERRVAWIESVTDGFAAQVDLPREFILPGQSVAGAALDVARAVARRAERQVVILERSGHAVNSAILGYMNRLSSLLFVAARIEDQMAGNAPLRAKMG
jgi:cob(I)alamin adenosyltransferase